MSLTHSEAAAAEALQKRAEFNRSAETLGILAAFQAETTAHAETFKKENSLTYHSLTNDASLVDGATGNQRIPFGERTVGNSRQCGYRKLGFPTL